MANLFDILPKGFFNYLASNASNRVYADCLEIIYDAYDREVSYRIPRNRIRDALAAYLMDNHIDLSDEEEAGADKYQMASSILRRFTDPNVHWLEEDNDDATYEKQIVMSEHGIALAEFLLSLRRPEKEEYAGYINQIYSILNNPDLMRDDPYINVLRPIYRDAKALARSLKRLATFIRQIIDEMVHEESLESITENLIMYSEGSFIKEYTRLTKQQNIHTYRIQIIERLEGMRGDTQIMQNMTDSHMKEDGIGFTQAQDDIYDMIQNTIRFLSGDYDQIMLDIKHKINLYMQLHIGHLRFLQTRDGSARGHVERAIHVLAEEMTELDMKDEIPDDMDDLFHVGGTSYLDLSSLRYPRKIRRVAQSEEDTIEEMTAQALVRAREEQQREANNPYNQKKMKAYLEHLMAGKSTMQACEFPLAEKDDLLRGLSAVAYAAENGFEVTPEDSYVETDRFVIRNFEVRRQKN